MRLMVLMFMMSVLTFMTMILILIMILMMILTMILMMILMMMLMIMLMMVGAGTCPGTKKHTGILVYCNIAIVQT